VTLEELDCTIDESYTHRLYGCEGLGAADERGTANTMRARPPIGSSAANTVAARGMRSPRSV
jgi:hypothetical protein